MPQTSTSDPKSPTASHSPSSSTKNSAPKSSAPPHSPTSSNSQSPDKDPSTPTIIKTDTHSKDGQVKCPKCGSTDISTNTKKGVLRCNFCRHEFQPQKLTGLQTDLKSLKGEIFGSGATDIIADAKDIITFKCSSCGAEVVVNTKTANQARCHWCRNTLSVNQQIQNGAIPDAVLPFSTPKAEAESIIQDFVKKRTTFAHPKFKQEFTTDNIMGVYFPYMIVDANTHINLSGEGEHTTRTYYRGSDDNRKKYFDADVFRITRDFNLYVSGLSVESSSEKLHRTSTNTNNVINAIMPFDVENCVHYDSNYLAGFTSEKRDTNIDDLKPLVSGQLQDIARHAAIPTLDHYDRGVRWDQENFKIHGQQWKSAYLPVWLYSYQQVSGDKKLLHYVAVNARTKEIMGSVPIHYPKLLMVAIGIEILSLLTINIVRTFYDKDYLWLMLASGPLFFLITYMNYRNTDARHAFESDTQTTLENLQKTDEKITTRTKLENPRMDGANHDVVNSSNSLD